MTNLLDDLRYSLRRLAASPGFTALAGLTLALGIGANSALWSVVSGVLLAPLPLPEPGRLVVIWETRRDQRGSATAPDFLDWQRQARAFSGFGATTSTSVNLTGRGEPERLPAARVSAGWFPTLGVRPKLGRGFTAEEDREGGPRAVLLSDGLWRRRFGADPGIVGRTVEANGLASMVVGVMPATAVLPRSAERAEELWLPLALTRGEIESTGSHFLTVVGRLAPGTSTTAAAAEMRGIAAGISRLRPQSNTGLSVALVDLKDALVGEVKMPLLLLLGAVGFVLLIACANVANLLLARSAARQREIAVRAALGAGRGRLVRQLLTESLALAVAGGAAGLLLAAWSSDLLRTLLPANLPRRAAIGIDGRVLAFTLALTLLTGLLFGVAPSLAATRRDLQAALAEASRGSAGPGRQRLWGALVVAEVALAVVLLAGSGLLLRSFFTLTQVDPGFDGRGLLTLRVAAPSARYGTPESAVALYDQLLSRVQALPGVRSATAISDLPLADGGESLSIFFLGRPTPRVEDVPSVFARLVSPAALGTFGIPLLRGRDLTPADRQGALRVGLVNSTAARRFWPGEDPLGKQITLDDGDPRPLTVVGIAGDVRHFGLGSATRPELYFPYAQAPALQWTWLERSMTLVVRVAGEGEAAAAGLSAGVRGAVAAVDRDLPVYRVATMGEVRARSLAGERVYMLLLSLFAALALLLAAVGVYGVIAFAVTRRTREIGIRIALGAREGRVLGLVLGQGMAPVAAGAVLGLAAAAGLTRLLSRLLYGVAPVDPGTFAAAALLLAGVAFAASWLPARRAARIDPVVALRME